MSTLNEWLGDGPDVLNLCSGSFLLDAAYSPQRLSEAAKFGSLAVIMSTAESEHKSFDSYN